MNDIHPQRRLAAALAVALLAMPAMAGAQEGGAVDRPVQPMPAPRAIPDLRRGSPATAPPAATRPVIGVVLAPGSRDVVIVAVTPDSPAARAGLRTGDRLVEIGGHRLLGSTPALRADNARRLLGDLTPARAVRLAVMRGDERREVSVTPERADRVIVWVDGAGRELSTHGDVVVVDRRAMRELHAAPGVATEIRRELAHLDDAAGTPTLLEAFRWNGLNLATIGPELGRYFGTQDGVLVLSTGPSLAGLVPGDVIRKVGTRRVDSPREAMDALRALPAGSQVTLDVLRERKSTQARITVPEALPALPLAPPVPPAPPAPPAPPPPPRTGAGTAAPAAPPPPSAPPAPPAPPGAPAPPEAMVVS